MAVRRRVLICESNEARGRGLADSLKAAGYDVASESDGADAWAALQSAPPQILVVDYDTKSLNGLELLALVSAAGLHIPVIFMTDAGTEKIAAEALNLGAACYLVKGSEEGLRAALEGALQRVGYQVDLEEQNQSLLARLKEQNDNLEASVMQRTVQLAAALEELQTLDARKSEFLKLVSHEMRTPLTAIIGFSEVIQQGLYDSQSEMLELHAHIHAAGQRLMNFVNDALELFGWYGGRKITEFSTVNGQAAVEMALTTVSGAAAAKGLRVRSELLHEWQVFADPALFHSALVRLLENAVKYSVQGGDVVVSGHMNSDDASIVVTDSGCGIATEKLQRLGRPLEIAGNIEHHSEGQGLGLAIVREILRAHGGEVLLRSEGEGRGTSATMRLPVTVPVEKSSVEVVHA